MLPWDLPQEKVAGAPREQPCPVPGCRSVLSAAFPPSSARALRKARSLSGRTPPSRVGPRRLAWDPPHLCLPFPPPDRPHSLRAKRAWPPSSSEETPTSRCLGPAASFSFLLITTRPLRLAGRPPPCAVSPRSVPRAPGAAATPSGSHAPALLTAHSCRSPVLPAQQTGDGALLDRPPGGRCPSAVSHRG